MNKHFEDAEHWRKLHIASERREPLYLPDSPARRNRTIHDGIFTRVERGGSKEGGL